MVVKMTYPSFIINVIIFMLFSGNIMANNEQETHSEPESTIFYVKNDTFKVRHIGIMSEVTDRRFQYNNLNMKADDILIPILQTKPIEVSKPNLSHLKQHPLNKLRMRLTLECTSYSNQFYYLDFTPSDFSYMSEPFENNLNFYPNTGIGTKENPIKVSDIIENAMD